MARTTLGLLLTFAFTSLGAGTTVAADPASAPRFQDYPALRHMSGRNAPLILTRHDMQFKTELRDAAATPANFAGHYILRQWGCGAGCVMGAAIDAQSGRVVWLPATICCWEESVQEPIRFRLDSTLISLSGLRNEKEGDQGTHFYRIDGLRFVHVRDLPAGK